MTIADRPMVRTMEDRITPAPAMCAGRPVVRGFWLVAVVFASSWIVAQSAGFHPAAGRKHAWQRLGFPPIPNPQPGMGDFLLTVDTGGHDMPPALRFSIMFPGRLDTPLPKPIADPTSFTVRLHPSDGKVVLPSDSNSGRRSYTVEGSSLGGTFSVSYPFSWMGPGMDPSWIELGIPGQTYWIGLPPGFLMDPAAGLPSDTHGGGTLASRVAPARGTNETVVNWKRAYYELGPIQGGGQLSLQVSSSGGTNAEVVLVRKRGLWTADDPKVELQIRTSQGGLVAGRHAGTRLHEHRMGRSDDFQLSVPPALGREWGVLGVKVDNQVYEQVVPLGLFGGSQRGGMVDNRARDDRPSPPR